VSKLRRVAYAWLPAMAYMALIFVLSAQPRLPIAPGLLGWDKLQHWLAYMVMGLLLIRAAYETPLPRISPYLLALIIGAAYAASDEYHQSFVPGRTMSIWDWLADLTGLLFALAVVYLYRRYRRR
jgi:VanZ family protein